jgi:hypothetical protein
LSLPKPYISYGFDTKSKLETEPNKLNVFNQKQTPWLILTKLIPVETSHLLMGSLNRFISENK